MGNTEPGGRSAQNACPYSAASEFEQAVNKAQNLLEKSDLDGALNLLSALETRYISCTKLFDLLGDVFLRKGDVEEGIRYKTLHEVLKGTFKIATQHAAGRQKDRPSALGEEKVMAPEAEAEIVPEFPMTAAMAQEFMRQGHYDRAAEIFAKLSRMHPEDKLLQEAGEKARKRRGEKEVVGVLERWLGKVDRMRLDKSGGV